jgi:hypothetical protein
MSTEAYAALLCGLGLAASVISIRAEDLSRTKWFRFTGLGVFLFFMMLMWNSLAPSVKAGGTQAVSEMGMAMFFTIIISVCWAVFFASFIGGTVANIVRSLISLDAIRNPPPLSLVDAAIKQRDYPVALERVQEVIRDFPDEPQPLRKLAELYLLMDRPDDAVQSYRRAAVVEPEESQKMVDTFNAADVLADVRRDLPAALDEIMRFIQLHPDVRGREFADERIGRLRERITGKGARA